MVGIALELDGAAVACFGDDAATGGALATGGGVVRGHARHRLVRRHEIRDELPRRLGARRGGNGGAGDAEHLEELAAPDALRL